MTYKKVIENSIDMQIFKMLDKQSEGKYFDIKKIEVTNEKEMLFVVYVEFKKGIIPLNYEIHGYVSDYGRAVVTYISYSRTISKKKNNGEYTEPRKEWFQIYGDCIKNFKFDK